MTATPPSPSLGLPIVYLVDDEDVVRDALGWLLRSRRLLSEGFASAEAFEAMLAAKSPAALAEWPVAPSCLLLDVRMPGMSGIELIRELRSAGNQTPILLLTALSQTDEKVSGFDAGADDYLSKPIDVDKLMVLLKKYVK